MSRPLRLPLYQVGRDGEPAQPGTEGSGSQLLDEARPTHDEVLQRPLKEAADAPELVPLVRLLTQPAAASS